MKITRVTETESYETENPWTEAKTINDLITTRADGPSGFDEYLAFKSENRPKGDPKGDRVLKVCIKGRHLFK